MGEASAPDGVNAGRGAILLSAYPEDCRLHHGVSAAAEILRCRRNLPAHDLQRAARGACGRTGPLQAVPRAFQQSPAAFRAWPATRPDSATASLRTATPIELRPCVPAPPRLYYMNLPWSGDVDLASQLLQGFY